MSWYIKVLKNYANFEGRARREEYWMFYLFFFVIGFSIGVVMLIIDFLLKSYIGSIIYNFYPIALLLPAIAVTVRRLHDIGKSGWWIFISLIPLAGPIWLLVLLCTEGTPGQNQYGPNPKEETQFVPTVPTTPVVPDINQPQF